jgi:hypothetical protein
MAFGCVIALCAGSARAEDAPLDANPPATAAEPAPGANGSATGEENSAPVKPDSPAEAEALPEEEAVPEEEVPTPADAGKLPPHGTVDVVHGVLSREVLTTAEWLDSFFDDPRYSAEDNRTRVKVGLEYSWDRAEKSDFGVPISVQLRLPRLENKARVVLLGSPDQDLEGQTPPSGSAASRLPGAQENNFTTAVDYYFLATERLNIATRLGVRFREGTAQVYVQPRYRQLVKFDPWSLRFVQDFKWWTKSGWESTTTLDLERPLDKKFFFRSTLQGAWTEQEKDIYYYSLSFNLRQILSARSVVQYELVNGFQTRNDPLDEIRATVRYRRQFWRDWMFYEVAPYASFRRDQDFDFTPGILLRLEMFFGKYEGVGP